VQQAVDLECAQAAQALQGVVELQGRQYACRHKQSALRAMQTKSMRAAGHADTSN
jgi:hypothetical protein